MKRERTVGNFPSLRIIAISNRTKQLKIKFIIFNKPV